VQSNKRVCLVSQYSLSEYT